jgi:methionyl-tRNA formyltransferase
MTPIVFFGSSSYSLIILEKLITIAEFPLISVVTKPDKAQGRSQTISPNPVAEFARRHQLPLLQPDEFTPAFIKNFYALKPALAIVVAYGPPFFSPEMIDIPTFKIVNIHPSPLPKYRGATPGPWQIINSETKSAVTFFQIDAKPDHGPIINQIPFEISSKETSESFYQKAFLLAANNLQPVLSAYINAPHLLTPQDDNQKSYFPKLTKDQAKIDWRQSPQQIDCFVRALIPWPIAWTEVKTSQGLILKMKIYSGKIQNNQYLPIDVQIEGKTKSLWSQVQPYYQLIL